MSEKVAAECGRPYVRVSERVGRWFGAMHGGWVGGCGSHGKSTFSFHDHAHQRGTDPNPILTIATRIECKAPHRGRGAARDVSKKGTRLAHNSTGCSVTE
jgi:hypothetical protein